MQLQNFHPSIIGENAITTQIVCADGAIRTVRTEQFVEGFAAYITKEDGEYTKRTTYKTARKAINAAAKW